MVDMLTSNSWVNWSSVLSLANLTGILELRSLSIESLLYMVIIAMVDLLLLDSSEVVGMLLWKNLLILDWLDGSVMVILVDLTINGSGGLLMSGLANVLVGNSWVDYKKGKVQWLVIEC